MLETLALVRRSMYLCHEYRASCGVLAVAPPVRVRILPVLWKARPARPICQERGQQGIRTPCGAPVERWPDAAGHALMSLG